MAPRRPTTDHTGPALPRPCPPRGRGEAQPNPVAGAPRNVVTVAVGGASEAVAPSPSGTARTVAAPSTPAGHDAVKSPLESAVVCATGFHAPVAGSSCSTRTGPAPGSVALQRT